jgi:hypothetical protein
MDDAELAADIDNDEDLFKLLGIGPDYVQRLQQEGSEHRGIASFASLEDTQRPPRLVDTTVRHAIPGRRSIQLPVEPVAGRRSSGAMKEESTGRLIRAVSSFQLTDNSFSDISMDDSKSGAAVVQYHPDGRRVASLTEESRGSSSPALPSPPLPSPPLISPSLHLGTPHNNQIITHQRATPDEVMMRPRGQTDMFLRVPRAPSGRPESIMSETDSPSAMRTPISVSVASHRHAKHVATTWPQTHGDSDAGTSPALLAELWVPVERHTESRMTTRPGDPVRGVIGKESYTPSAGSMSVSFVGKKRGREPDTVSLRATPARSAMQSSIGQGSDDDVYLDYSADDVLETGYEGSDNERPPPSESIEVHPHTSPSPELLLETDSPIHAPDSKRFRSFNHPSEVSEVVSFEDEEDTQTFHNTFLSEECDLSHAAKILSRMLNDEPNIMSLRMATELLGREGTWGLLLETLDVEVCTHTSTHTCIVFIVYIWVRYVAGPGWYPYGRWRTSEVTGWRILLFTQG